MCLWALEDGRCVIHRSNSRFIHTSIQVGRGGSGIFLFSSLKLAVSSLLLPSRVKAWWHLGLWLITCFETNRANYVSSSIINASNDRYKCHLKNIFTLSPLSLSPRFFTLPRKCASIERNCFLICLWPCSLRHAVPERDVSRLAPFFSSLSLLLSPFLCVLSCFRPNHCLSAFPRLDAGYSYSFFSLYDHFIGCRPFYTCAFMFDIIFTFVYSWVRSLLLLSVLFFYTLVFLLGFSMP